MTTAFQTQTKEMLKQLKKKNLNKKDRSQESTL